MKCKCDMRTKLLGDGCEACNPQLALDMALGAYWEAAVAEGAEGRDHDTPDGDAQRALKAVHSAVAAMVTAERETARGLNLELDLRRLLEGEPTICEFEIVDEIRRRLTPNDRIQPPAVAGRLE